MAKRNETTLLVLALLITATLLGVGFWLFRGLFSPPGQSPSVRSNLQSKDRVSLGDKLLIIANASQAKQTGIEAFAKKDYETAVTKLKASLKDNRNDPEALIYLNNAQLRLDRKSPLKIAVSVPIGSNLNVSQEILRGVAQAQDELNRRAEIPLEVAIANDDNNPEIAKQVAAEFVQDASVLAVVGHNSSDASIAAAPIYEQGKLTMITSTSSADAISGIGSYVFRVVPSSRLTADVLSRYVLKTARKTAIAICLDSKSPDSQSFANNMISAMTADGGRFVNIGCDLAAPDFRADAIVSKAVSSGAEALLLAPQVDRLDAAINVARTNQGRLLLVGNQTMYTINTLKLGQADVNGLVLPVSWHPDAIANNPFTVSANQYWGGRVNWRTAMSYDTVLTIVAGLKSNSSRDGLQKALSSPDFSTMGATGKIQFLPSGDRSGAPIMVRVQPGAQSEGYEFAPIKF
ncbi:ABC transporter substrate-binding protein [Phormidesmis sp. 146-33]